MIVVIFQEELRQMFERIALWSLGRQRVVRPPSDTTDILVRTVADLVRDKIGALIVIRGGDPLERHITGGILLDGKLSIPLLRSLFEPHSPGHDGAVLIDKDRILRFAAHLPLSKNLNQAAIFYLLDAKHIQVSVDVSLAEVGRRTFKLSEANIRFPKELALADLNPATVKLSVKKVPMPRNDTAPSDAKG